MQTTKQTVKTNWHLLDETEVLKLLETNKNGLSTTETAARLAKNGKNVLPQKKKITLLTIIWHQFASPIIYVLIFSAGLSLFIGEKFDALLIFIIIFVNACIGAYQEWQAETNANALQKLIQIQTQVVRDDKIITINSEELVLGDKVLLEAGNKVPADLRVLQSNNLTIEESLLTGESLPIIKNNSILTGENLPIADKLNMVFAGTIITNGKGEGVVVATGQATEIGKIATAVTETNSEKAPFVVRMETFTKKITGIALIICLVIGVIGYFSGMPLYQLFLFIVALAVSAIPEGLPIAITVALSIGTRKLAQKNVIIRKLTAVEGLGSCTMIATDKTGTLTVDQQTVKEIVFTDGKKLEVSGEGYSGIGTIQATENQDYQDRLQRLIRQSVICNNGTLHDGHHHSKKMWEHSGDAVDIALLALAYKAQMPPAQILETVKIVGEIPFDATNKYAAVFYQENGNQNENQNGQITVAVKGAAEIILQRTRNIDKGFIENLVTQLAESGYRVLAVANKTFDTNPQNFDDNTIQELDFVGLLALIDPVRKEVKGAIAKCHKAGVAVAMVTGDHPATALAIAKQINITQENSHVLSGKEFGEMEGLAEQELIEKIKDKRVFARFSPQQKQKLVATMVKAGHYVAVTGDGVNDAPALKAAHIGIAMGSGTDIAKDTASIIIVNNNFVSIAMGIAEGRLIYSNLRKIIYFLVSSGVSELGAILFTITLGLPLPFLAVQLLWLNMVTDSIQSTGFAFEKEEKGLMARPPRDPKEQIFDALMIQQILIAGLVMGGLVCGVWYYLLEYGNYSEAQARNMTLLLMVLLQNVHILNCRSETVSLFKIPFKYNYFLIFSALGVQALHIGSMYVPFMQKMLKIAPISIYEWLSMLGIALILPMVMEVFKWAKRRKLSSKKK